MVKIGLNTEKLSFCQINCKKLTHNFRNVKEVLSQMNLSNFFVSERNILYYDNTKIYIIVCWSARLEPVALE